MLKLHSLCQTVVILPAMKDFSSEFIFKTSRSGGKGGQNVNKVETKVELRFHVMNSVLLDEKQKALVLEKCAARINDEGYLIIVSQSERTQLGNKENAVAKFDEIIAKALTPVKKRKKSKVPASVKEKRLSEKKRKSETKENRRKLY